MDKTEDVTELLDAIVWGRRIVEVRNGQDEEVTFVFRPLTLEEKNMGNYIHKKALVEATRQGLLTRKELIVQATEQDLWKPAYEDDLRTLRQELAKQIEARDEEMRTKMLDSKGRPKRNNPTSKLRKLNDRVASLSETIHKIDVLQTQHIELPSAEYCAECKRGYYFLRCATLTFPEMDQKWSSMDEFDDEGDTVLVARLMHAYYNDALIDESSIRRIARSGFWRCQWVGSKKNRGVMTLFKREMFELTTDQFRLVYWSQVYDSAFESMEPPSDRVIDDDKLFDKWLEEQHRKREQERKKSEFDKKFSKLDKKNSANEVGFNVQGEWCEECTCGVKEEAEARGVDKRGTIHDPSCPYGVFLYYGEETKTRKVEEIQSANPDNVRKLLASEQKRLAEAGVDGVEEQNLRGDKARSALGIGTTVHGPGELGKGKKR